MRKQLLTWTLTPLVLAARSEPEWWSQVSAGYLLSIARRGRRPNTRRAYDVELRDLGDWLQRAGISTLGDFNRQHLEAWQDEVQGRKAPHTQQVAAAAVRGALRWAADHDLPLSTPSLWLRVVHCRAPRLKPRPIPVRDLEAISMHLDLIVNPSLHDLRTRALFWLILSSGARISEALSLLRTSIVNGTAIVIQKGGSEHCLMVSGKACVAINDYVRARTDQSPVLFVSHDAYRPLSPLGKQEAQRGWNQLCRNLGIPRFTSHQIRHSCATELLRQKVDSLVIAKHMGHHGLQSIQGYAEVGLDSRRLAMQALDGRLAS